jgi:hypothetical protein
MVFDPFYEAPGVFEIRLGASWIHSTLNDVVISLVSVVHHPALGVAVLVLDQPGFDKVLAESSDDGRVLAAG